MSGDTQDPGSAWSDTGVLGAASIANGLLSYLFVAIGTRAYGAAAFAPLSVVWSLWALGIAVLAFPFQHRVILLRETGVAATALRQDRRRLLGVGIGCSLALALVLVPVRAEVFGSTELALPAITGGVILSSAWLGLTRGDLAGTGRPRQAGAILVLEQVVRVVAGLGVVAVGGDVIGYGWTLPLALLLVLGWRTPPSTLSASGQPTGLGRYLIAVAGGSLLGQLVLTGSPVVLSLLDGEPVAVTALFTSMAVARAPYLIGLGAAIRVMSDLGRTMYAVGRRGLRTVVARAVRWTLVAVAVVVPVAWLVGPAFLRLVFGADAALSGPLTALVAAGGLLATGSLILLLVQIAADRVASILLARSVGVALFMIAILVGWSDPTTRVVVGFLLSEVAAFVGLGVAAWRASRSSVRAARDVS